MTLDTSGTPSALSAELRGISEMHPVGLDDMNALTGILRRFDDKFLVQVCDLSALTAMLGPGWRVLEVDGRRCARYRSVYFDTPDLLSYRTHLQGCRRRYKIRTRTYLPSGITMLELKLKGSAGRTEKRRWTDLSATTTALDEAARSNLQQALTDTYNWQLPPTLSPSLVTKFDRITLVQLDRKERITIDVNLVVEANRKMYRTNPDIAIVETKTPTRAAGAFKTALKLGHRPVRVSKYCVGIAATNNAIRGNPWLPALRRLRPAVVS